ncbi:hypothetical protein [Spirosoma luteolum]
MNTFSRYPGKRSNALGFNVSGSQLEDNVVLTSEGTYVMSLAKEGTYSSSLTLPIANRSLKETTVWVRLLEGTTGNQEANIYVATPGLQPQVGRDKFVGVQLYGGTATVGIREDVPPVPVVAGETQTPQEIIVYGDYLQEKISVSVSAGFLIADQPDGTYATNLDLPYGFETGQTVYVKLIDAATVGKTAGKLTATSGEVTKELVISGEVVEAGKPADEEKPPVEEPPTSMPQLRSSAKALKFNKVGEAKRYFLSGVDLPGDYTIGVEAPAGFAVSTDNAQYGATLELKSTSAGTIEQVVWVKMLAQNASGEVTNTLADLVGTNVMVGAFDPANDQGIVLSTTALTPFKTTLGTPSAPQAYQITGFNIDSEFVFVGAPEGFELSEQEAGPYEHDLTLFDVGVGKTVWVRLGGTATGPYAGEVSHGGFMSLYPEFVSVSGSVEAVPTASALTLSVDKLDGFSTTQGTASAAKSYDLTNQADTDTEATLTAPAGYELSPDGTTFGNPLPVSLKAKSSRTISVRLSAKAPVGPLAGVIVNQQAGAYSPVSLALTGAVSAVKPTLTASVTELKGFVTATGVPSAVQSFKLAGSQLPADVSFHGPSELEMSFDGVNFMPWAKLAQTNGSVDATVYVRVSAWAGTGPFTGELTMNSNDVQVVLPIQGEVTLPQLAVYPAELTGFDAIQGTPSKTKTYQLKTGPVVDDVTVMSSGEFEISLDGISFHKDLAIKPTAGQVNVTLFVRMNSSSHGTIQGMITHLNRGGYVGLPLNGVASPAGPVTVSAVKPLGCESAPGGGQVVSLMPQLSNNDPSQPTTFEIVNELAPTTAPGPYAIKLYADNPLLTMRVTQNGQTTSFAYNWVAGCASLSNPTTPTPPTTPPTTPTTPTTPVAGFAISAVQPVSCVTLEGGVRQVSFTPQYSNLDGSAVTFAVLREMLPTTAAGPYTLKLYPDNAVITLQATQSGQTVTLNYNWLAGCTNPTAPADPTQPTMPTPPAPVPAPATATIQTVQTQCNASEGGARQVSFTPQYAGDQGTPILFEIVNELAPTTAPGPYAIKLYADNPTVIMRVTQNGQTTQFTYNWLGACLSKSGRIGVAESREPLAVQVLGNPVVGGTVRAEVRGAAGQALDLELLDSRGQVIDRQRTASAGVVETASFEVGRQAAGMLLLRARTSQQVQTIKVLKAD